MGFGFYMEWIGEYMKTSGALKSESLPMVSIAQSSTYKLGSMETGNGGKPQVDFL